VSQCKESAKINDHDHNKAQQGTPTDKRIGQAACCKVTGSCAYLINTNDKKFKR